MSKVELPEKYSVKFKHERDTLYLDGEVVTCDRGGSTMAWVFDGDGKDNTPIAYGEALCRTDEINRYGELVKGDQFDKALGRQIALGRALAALKRGRPLKNGHGSPVNARLAEFLKENPQEARAVAASYTLP